MKPLLLILAGILTGPLSAQEAAPLKTDDIVRLTIYGEDDLATQTTILKSKEAVFPLIGAVKVAGLSIQEATTRIRDLYARDYLVEPKVTLTVVTYATEYGEVVGSVLKPGRVPIPENGRLDVSSALAAAGGFAPNADPNRITLVRADGSRLSLTESSLKSGSSALLKSGDRVVVSESAYVGRTLIMRGQIRKPGPLAFPLDGKLDLIAALSLAGDLTELAQPKKVTVTRSGKVIPINLNELTTEGSKRFFLQPDDIVNVPERMF